MAKIVPLVTLALGYESVGLSIPGLSVSRKKLSKHENGKIELSLENDISFITVETLINLQSPWSK